MEKIRGLGRWMRPFILWVQSLIHVKTCCESHNINCNQGRNCPYRKKS